MKGEPFVPVPNRGMITISIMMANIMQGVDNSILNVALPHIQGSLSASLDQIAWALTSYIVCAAIMMPLTGWLAGRFGIKYIFLVSVIGFTLASALCGVATSLGEPVLFRALQGVAGAGLSPLSPVSSSAAPSQSQPPPDRDERGITNERRQDCGVGRRNHAADPRGDNAAAGRPHSSGIPALRRPAK